MSEDVPLLIPYEPAEFWDKMRMIVREEIFSGVKRQKASSAMATPGLTEKPLYKIVEICAIFNVSRTTVHEWVKSGKLRKVKVRSRVYFLADDVRKIFLPAAE